MTPRTLTHTKTITSPRIQAWYLAAEGVGTGNAVLQDGLVLLEQLLPHLGLLQSSLLRLLLRPPLAASLLSCQACGYAQDVGLPIERVLQCSDRSSACEEISD